MNWSFASGIKKQAASLCNITKTLDNFDTQDLLFFFNECYTDAYRRICRIDPGFYSIRERLDVLIDYARNPLARISGTDAVTLPDYVLEVVNIYEAQEKFDTNRVIYSNSNSFSRDGVWRTYTLEGRTLHIDRSQAVLPIWVEYIPQSPIITWPVKNHDPEIMDEADIPPQPGGDTIGYFRIDDRLAMHDLRTGGPPVDMKIYYEDDEWECANFLISEPYLIINYKNRFLPDKRQIRIYSQLAQSASVKKDVWNAFDWKGRPTNCECLYAVHNDFTLGDMIVRDYDDGGKIKRLGFFPDTRINYPNTITRDLLTYRLADRLAKLSAIDSPLIRDGMFEAEDRFGEYARVNRAAFHQIEVVRPFSHWL